MRKPPAKPIKPRWKKGESGNPGGRPKGFAELRELARTHGEHCIERLVTLSNDPDGRIAVAACSILLDRGYGKPMQAVEVSDGRKSVSENQKLIDSMTIEELRAVKTIGEQIAKRQAQLTHQPVHADTRS